MAKILYPYPEPLTFQRAREIHTAKMCEALALAGHEVTWLIGETPGVDENVVRQKLGLTDTRNLRMQFAPRHFQIGPLKIGARSRFFRRMEEVIAQRQFDLIYCIHLKAVDHFLKNRPKAKILFEAHEIFADAYSKDNRRYRSLTKLEERIYPHVDCLVCTSDYLRSEIKNRYGLPPQTIIAFNAVENFSVLEFPPQPTEPDTAIYCGSLIDWKGVDILIESWKQVPEKKLIICGGKADEIKTLQSLAGTMGVAERITFTGHLSRAEISRWLAKAKVAVAPNKTHPKSSLYSFPMKVLEYAACGKAVVASAIPVIKEIEPHFLNLHLSEPENPDLLAQKIMEAFASERGTQMIAPEEFTWESRARKVAGFISSAE
ncbi:glycosyltransferase family 4 protein [Kamptonema cortianum]|nr:glycosyltransferase family 4 protein [Oscillatoria laete-virens]MDK3156452.1 glycosyltransferase family 4 protein [Kamptonema cortianum]MDL5053866.1 glycosyltransferase family 4 protein [Oscillatoria laete-virens NRMC-F 0139]